MMGIINIFMNLPQALLVVTCEGWVANFIIVQPAEAFLKAVDR